MKLRKLALLVLALALVAQVALAQTAADGLPTARRTIAPSFKLAPGPVKIALFDADSTLRVAPSGKPSANSPDDVAILPLVARELARLESEGYLIGIASNQAGIAAGYVTFETADQALRNTMRLLVKAGGRFHYYDFAEANDDNRKPDIGMGRRLASLIKTQLGRNVDWNASIMVGDSAWKKGADVEPDGTPGEDISNADRLFAENLAKEFGGLTFHHPRSFFHWIRLGVKNFHTYVQLQDFLKAHPELDPLAGQH